LLIAMALDVLGVGGAPLAAFGFVSSLQLQIAQLSGVERRSSPRVAFAFAQQMPDDHRQLPSRGDSGDMLTSAGADSGRSGVRWPQDRRANAKPITPRLGLGGGPGQEYFGDGVTESPTADLSRIAGAFVIAGNTAFTFKGKPFDVKTIGRELHVRYVIEGSVQRAGNRGQRSTRRCRDRAHL
jgi:hypothetical protein